jgi:hypothetical protein
MNRAAQQPILGKFRGHLLLQVRLPTLHPSDTRESLVS